MRNARNPLFLWERSLLILLMFCFSIGFVSAQQVTVTGKVTGAEGTIPGVNVVLQGTTNGVITDMEGSYSIQVPGPDAVLVFSFIGMVTQTVTVGNQTTIDVVMKTDVSELDVVVVTGYGTQKKATVTGSVSAVKGEMLQKIPTNNLSNTLIGQVPGLMVVNRSGEPGADDSQIRIRGINTLNNSSALIVIDGIADLIGSVNDEEQSVDLVNTLFQIAGRYNTLLICVLHLNPGGIKLRGHLGSELQRKASGILSVEKRKDQSVSTVKALKLREADPLSLPIIQFAWQETIQQHSFIGYLNSNEQINSKINKLKEFAERIFSANSIIQSTELGEYLMNHFDIKERMARNYIKLMRENLIIKKEHSHQNAYILSNID